MPTFYHGTTLENFKKILKNGFNNKSKKNWGCSNESELYLWNPRKLEGDRDAKQKAFESAQLAAAIQDVSKTEIVVLELEIDTNQINVPDDDSAVNMKNSANYVLKERLNLSNISCVYWSRNGYIPGARLLYLLSIFQDSGPNNYFPFYCINKNEMGVLKEMKEQNIETYFLYDIEHEKLSKDVWKNRK